MDVGGSALIEEEEKFIDKGPHMQGYERDRRVENPTINA